MEGAHADNGQLALDGINDYVNLPIGGTIASLTDATVEAWVKWDSASGQTWARLFDFNDNAQSYMFLTPSNGAAPRFAITTSHWGGEQVAASSSGFPEGVLTHVAVTSDSAAGVTRLYVNGTQVAQQSTTLTPASLGTTSNNWLGRSLYTADPFLKGSISEFRIYRTALSPSRIAVNSSAGPDDVEL
jgi:hypothetical protein